MNLLYDPWLPFRLSNGQEEKRPLSGILDPDTVDFALPRADFQGAAYQFVIGVLQTAFAPQNRAEWQQYYQRPPSKELLKAALKTIEHAFYFDGEGALFMQDHDPLLQNECVPISGLLIDAPGENGIKNNTDFFVKRGVAEVMSPEMAALALFTLQINAPSGGVGHRVGLRGGGPLTTLVMPSEASCSLWKKLWLNVINKDKWRYPDPNFYDGSVFPWLVPTIDSKQKGTEIYQGDVHALHCYWAMPRRIRISVEDVPASCSLSGLGCNRSVRFYRTKNYGNNYVGNWDPHPFTPYTWDPKKPAKEHLPVKGQPGGVSYKIWSMLTLSNTSHGQVSARVIDHYHEVVMQAWQEQPQLWVFGYDMANMKPRGWYSTQLPFFHVEPGCRDEINDAVEGLQNLSNKALYQTRRQIKAAWFKRPGEVKGDLSFIDLSFWQQTEVAFYTAVSQITHNIYQQTDWLSMQEAKDWRYVLRSTCERLFDDYAFDHFGEGQSMAERMKARQELKRWLFHSKEIKQFNQMYRLIENQETSHA